MTTRTVFIEVFSLMGVDKAEAIKSTHKMAKSRKRSRYRLNTTKVILWTLILAVAVGFAFLWYKLLANLFVTLFE